MAVVIDNQFRPTPQSKLLPAVLDAIEAAGVDDACVICANGKVFPMSESDIEQKLGRENLARMERLGIPFLQNEPRNAEAYTYVGVSSRGTPVWLHKEVAQRDVKITIGQAQANHWGAGGGGKLILPGVVSDETIESNHCDLVPSPQTHYGAYAGPMRSDIDEVATMCGLDCTMNVVLDTHGRVIECIFGSHPEAHRSRSAASTRSTPTSTRGAARRHRDLRRFRADRPSLLPHRLGLHVGRPRREGRRHDHLLQPVAGRLDRHRRLPRPRADGPDEALHAADAGELRARAQGHPRAEIQMWAGCIWVPIYEVMTRKHLTIVTLEENLEMAADIGIDATTSLDEAFAQAMERHGPDAKVIVLPFARYQLPRNASGWTRRRSVRRRCDAH